jgi:hypothetical protein
MSFIQLRQAVIGVPEIAPSAAQARKELGLAPGFADPLLEDMGMADESIVLGDGRSFLEFVAPLNDQASIARWMAKGGGPGGYALSIQVGELAPYRARLAEAGVDLVADVEVYGYQVVQLHPKAMGLLVELDEVPDPAKWFWDDVEKEHPSDPQVDAFTHVELSSPDPAAQAAQWSAVFGVPVSDGELHLGDLAVRFVEGPRPFMSAIGLRRSAGSRLAPGSDLTLDGVRIDLS